MRIYERNTKSNNFAKSCLFVDSDKFVVSNRSLGAIALPTVIIVSGIVVGIVVSLVIVSRIGTFSGLANRLGAEALYIARSGAEDGIIKVIRYKNCPGTGCPASYSVVIGARTANVSICDNGGGVRTVKSRGTAGSYKKMIKVTLVSDTVTGDVSIKSFDEIPTESLSCST